MKSFIIRILAVAAILVSCNKAVEQPALPELSVDKTSLNIGMTGATEKITVTANRSVRVESSAEWLAFDPEEIQVEAGVRGQYVIEVTALPTNIGNARTAEFTVKTATHHAQVNVTQEGDPAQMPIDIYYNNFDKETVSANSYLNESDAWRNESGSGVTDELTYYDGNGISARTSSSSSYSEAYSASGKNNLYFGNNTASFTIGKIALHEDHRGLILTFGTQKYENYNISDFKLMVSVDGAKWVTLDFTVSSGSTVANNTWVLATAQFTLPASADYLYIRFAPTAAQYRIDDVTLIASTDEVGTKIDWNQATSISMGELISPVTGE